MRVLVTGHLGYIGTVMIPMLLKAGHDVVGYDTDLYAACTFIDGIVEVPSIKKDIRDATVDDLRGFDAVIHLAGLSNDPLGDLNPELTFEINHKATTHMATMAKEAGVSRFLFSSSCSNYGAAGDNLIDENGEFNPVTPYGVSKVRAEGDLKELADENFTPVIFRSATAYGLSPRIRFDLVLNNLVAWAFSDGKVFIKSDGTPWRPIVHIADISRAFIAGLEAPKEKVYLQAFNVGISSENYRIRELADIVKETVPNCKIEYAEDAGPDKRCYRVSCDKLPKIMPAFKPQWTARKGAKQLYDAYLKTSLSVDDFEGPRYKRLAHIQKLMKEDKLDVNLRWKNTGNG